jgi:hypothetical protein
VGEKQRAARTSASRPERLKRRVGYFLPASFLRFT